MRFSTNTRKVTIRLSDDERFTYVPERDTRFNDTTPSIRVTEIEMTGDMGWAKGFMIRKDGTVGSARREVMVLLDRLPLVVLVKLCRYLIEPSSEGLSMAEQIELERSS